MEFARRPHSHKSMQPWMLGGFKRIRSTVKKEHRTMTGRRGAEERAGMRRNWEFHSIFQLLWESTAHLRSVTASVRRNSASIRICRQTLKRKSHRRAGVCSYLTSHLRLLRNRPTCSSRASWPREREGDQAPAGSQGPASCPGRRPYSLARKPRNLLRKPRAAMHHPTVASSCV